MPSVTRCALDYDGAEWDIDERNRGGGSLRYRIETDAAMNPNAIANAALSVGPNPLPSPGQQYSYLGATANAFARRYRYSRERGSRTIHFYDVAFEPYRPGEQEDYFDVNPLLRPAAVHWASEQFTYRTDFDQTGDPIVNYCGQRYEDPIDEIGARGILVVKFNVATFPYTIGHQQTWELATNSIDWDVLGDASLVVPARRAWIKRFEAEPLQTEGTTYYYPERYEIAFAHNGTTWDRRLKEVGYSHWKKIEGVYIDNDDGSAHKLFNGSGSENDAEYTHPINLAADGTRLEEGLDTLYTDWRVKREADFNALPFMPLVFPS